MAGDAGMDDMEGIETVFDLFDQDEAKAKAVFASNPYGLLGR